MIPAIVGIYSVWSSCMSSALIKALHVWNRFTQRSPWPWLAITSSFGTLVTALLVGYKFYAVVNHTPKVESSFQNMVGIKKRE
jgi:hypothetical protein